MVMPGAKRSDEMSRPAVAWAVFVVTRGPASSFQKRRLFMPCMPGRRWVLATPGERPLNGAVPRLRQMHQDFAQRSRLGDNMELVGLGKQVIGHRGLDTNRG